MEAEGIKKALECCASPEYKCEECPIDKQKKDDCVCGQFLAQNAVALIKKLTTKTEAQDIVISELRHRVEKAEHDAERYSKKIKELTEENKAWQEQLISQEEKSGKAYYDLACEVENLRTENENLHTSYTELKQECKKWQGRVKIECDYTKADTVRKMQERLKERFNTASRYTKYSGAGVVMVIDQIAKEMSEGT